MAESDLESRGQESQPEHEEPDPDLAPYLVIPYFAGDTGTRPLPSNVPSWLCQGIHVNGLPYVGLPYKTGDVVNLSAVVENLGALGANVVVRFYWADPTTGFTPGNVNAIQQVTLYAPAASKLESPQTPWEISSDVPSHACLLAEVSGPGDLSPAPATFDVVNDRHYGQQNLAIKVVLAGKNAAFEFEVGNPKTEEADFRVRALPVAEESLEALERLYRAQAVRLEAEAIRLRIVTPGRIHGRCGELFVELQPEQQLLCQVIIRSPPRLEASQFVAVEVQQMDARSDQIVGSVGFVAFGKGDSC